MAVQKAFTQICQEILDRYDSVLQTNSLSTQTKREILAAKAAVQSLKEHIETKHNEIQELFERLDKNLAKNELINKEVDVKMANLADKADEAINDISSIRLEITNRVSDLERSILIANTAAATLNSYNAKSYEILEKFQSNEIVQATYLLKGEIMHTNAKLSANRLSLALREGATMAHRIKYELSLRSFVANNE